MNITARNCGNCAAFNPAPRADEQACGNLVYFIVGQGEQETYRDPSPVDLCPSHMSVTEDAHENALISEHYDIGGVYGAISASSSVAMARDAVRKASGGL
ncbi:hypothetical protein ACVBEH_05020 [Roseateles sp. GG27B]